MTAAVRVNPALVVFGNPPHSERQALQDTIRYADEALSAMMRGDKRAASYALKTIQHGARVMLAQLDRGVHANPSLRGGAPMRGRVKIGSHVQAIAYIHAKDGDAYVHGFGNRDPSEADLKRGILRLDRLKDVTNVEMYGNPDGTVTLVGTKGQPLAALFED